MKGGKMQVNKLEEEKIESTDIQEAIEQAEAVVFDIGNVLVSFAWEEYLKSLGFDEETY